MVLHMLQTLQLPKQKQQRVLISLNKHTKTELVVDLLLILHLLAKRV